MIALAALFSSNAATAHSGSRSTDGVQTEHIRFADLDLNSAAGKRALRYRVRLAAARLCLENNPDLRDVSATRVRCFDGAVTQGYRQIDERIAERAPTGASAVANGR
ncbi:MAG: UrcA family protein [Sphingomonas sp.]